MNNKKIWLALLGILVSSMAIAGNTTANMTATSVLAPSCTITAFSVNFGAFMLPLSAQSSSGSIDLLCTRDTPYTIEMAYGGVYGQGQTSDGSYWTLAKRDNGTLYYLYSEGGAFIKSSPWFGVRATQAEIASSLGCMFDGNNRCQTARPSYDYGMMSGAAKGDAVAYSIYIPGDNSKVWNSGKNSYSGRGTGEQEHLSFQLKIVPSQTSNKFPAPDFYKDAVTVNIRY
ncbi:spore coat protein U domain-containing protein [Delftia lacustris]